MSAGWVSLLGQLTAFAAVVALSPFSVIPAIALVIHSDRPKPTGLAFIAGWLIGKAAITAAFVQIPRQLHGLDGPAPHWTAWLRVGLGVATIAAGIWYWFKPPKPVEAPRWVSRIKKITPTGAFAIAVGLTIVNFKVFLACAAAGFTIGTAQLGVLGASAAVVYFTAVAGSTAAVPILAYTVWTHQVDRQLERFTDWLRRRQTAITTVMLVLIGIALLFSGIGAATAPR